MPVRQSVFGNVGTLLRFRVGHADAEAHEFGTGYAAHHFVQLDRFELLVKLLQDGAHGEPFRATSLPPLAMSARSRSQKLIARSRERFATPRVPVEEKLGRWMKGGMDC